MNDQIILSREYNNRELVPDHEQYFARWAEGSARARATMTCTTLTKRCATTERSL